MTFEPASAIPPTGVIYTRGFDVIELLQSAPQAAERLCQLRQRTSDAHSLTVRFEKRHDANTARGDVERRLQRLLAPRSQGGFDQPEDSREVVELKLQLAKLSDEARRLAELDEVRAERWRTASFTLQAVEGWLRDGRPGNTVLKDYDGSEPPKLLKGEDLLSALERIRRNGRELKATLHRVRSACFPSNYAKQRMRAQIEQLAQRGAPDVASLIEHDRQIEWARQQVQSQVRGREHLGLGFAETHDAVALVAWLHRDALIKRLDAEIDTEADDAASLSHEARQRGEAEVLGDILEQDRIEAALVWAGQSQGLPCEHRVDCSAAAILQCRSQTNGGGR